MVVRTHKSQLSDPFALMLQPPDNETPVERQKRVELEQEQKRVSDQIDDELKKERADRKRKAKREVKVLLLGQSESGKSTVLKNFRLKYAPTQWKGELRSWRAVIQLNLIHNVLTILDLMQDSLTALDSPQPQQSPSPSASSTPSATSSSSPWGRVSVDSTVSSITLAAGTSAPAAPTVPLTQKHRLLNLRLSPLREVADDLRRRLGASDDPEFSNFSFHTSDAAPSPSADVGVLGGGGGGDLPPKQRSEFGVRGWIGALGLPSPGGGAKKTDEAMSVDKATEILATLREDVVSLWEDPDVRELLKARGVRIEDRPGFFLSDTARIATRTYTPSDNDVVRARLRTLGVQEWRICLEHGNPELDNAHLFPGDSFGSEWVIYDVGGSRSMRHAWLPYFDAVNAIIFPISCFDERLAEDPSVNRLEDSMLLWRAVVSSKLLKQTTLIVFLNKCDLLKRKLQNGIQVNKYLISFGARENEVGTVVKYLKDKFRDIIHLDASQQRPTYLYATSVTDTKATAATLNIVRDGIIREHLKHAEFV
ncbi:guanine nucleotide-binding protein alpha-4 subunit [Favolaschia claudopus]|uniref:Guanine nucleotide-binding protein alpha-4 subunit n=1 Tax=Favolaschia claudopus TaxID=2862362 RepID=A0AAW0D131_9AGAR